VILCGLVSVAIAGPWTRHDGEYYARIGADGYVPRVYVNPLTGAPVDTDRRYLGVQLGVYGEVGLLKKWPLQLTAAAPATVGTLTFETAAGMGRATTYRFGDARIALQTALHREWPLALAIESKLPLYANDRVGREQGIYQEQFPKPGDGQIDLSAFLLAGGAKDRWWGELAVGWVHRTEAFVGWDVDLRFVDGIAFGGTFGAHVGDAYLMIKTDGRWNPVDDDVSREWLAVGPSVLYDISDAIGLEARFSYEPTSAQAARGYGFGIGVSHRK
jgi:hypothetical protein